METKLYIFSAKDGMQWLTGHRSEAARLTFIRQKIGKLVDFNAGERPYRGVLIYEDVSYIYACFLAPSFDFRGRDATYFIFAEIKTALLENLNVKALLQSNVFTQPLDVFQEDLSFSLSSYVTKGDEVIDLEDVFSNVTDWIGKVSHDTGIRLHQEGDETVTVSKELVFHFQSTITSKNVSFWNSSTSSLQANLQAIESSQSHILQQSMSFTPFTWSRSSSLMGKCNALVDRLWYYRKYVLLLLILLLIYGTYRIIRSLDFMTTEVLSVEEYEGECIGENDKHSIMTLEKEVPNE